MNSKAFPYTLLHGSHASFKTGKVREYEKIWTTGLEKFPIFFVKRKINQEKSGIFINLLCFAVDRDKRDSVATVSKWRKRPHLKISSSCLNFFIYRLNVFYRLTLQTNHCTASLCVHAPLRHLLIDSISIHVQDRILFLLFNIRDTPPKLLVDQGCIILGHGLEPPTMLQTFHPHQLFFLDLDMSETWNEMLTAKK